MQPLRFRIEQVEPERLRLGLAQPGRLASPARPEQKEAARWRLEKSPYCRQKRSPFGVCVAIFAFIWRSAQALAPQAGLSGSELGMRITLNLDDELLSQAQRLSGINERTQLIREALKALVQRESARRLAALGGSEPQLEAIPRRLAY
jgi:Arc/MetJ family transcription regulator